MHDHPSSRARPEQPDARSSARSSVGEAWQLLRLTGVEWWHDNAFRLAASLAFYTIFSIAPLLLIAVLLASLFFTRQAAAHRIEDELQTLVGNQGAQALRQIIESTQGLGSSAWAIAAGVVTVIVGSTAVFGELQAALNELWDVEVKVRHGLVRRLIADRARSFALVLGIGFLLLVSLVISGTLDALQDYLGAQMPRVPWLWSTSNFLTSFVVVALLFALITASCLMYSSGGKTCGGAPS